MNIGDIVTVDIRDIVPTQHYEGDYSMGKIINKMNSVYMILNSKQLLFCLESSIRLSLNCPEYLKHE